MFPTLTKWNGLPGLLMPIAVKPNRASATWEPEHQNVITSALLNTHPYSAVQLCNTTHVVSLKITPVLICRG